MNRKSIDKKKTETITIRVTPAQKTRIKDNANYLGMSISDYLCTAEENNRKRFDRFYKRKVNSVLVDTALNCDSLKTDLINCRSNHIDKDKIIARLEDITRGMDMLWYKK